MQAKTFTIAHVIPTVEFAPIDWATPDYSEWHGTPAWPAFWAEQLALIGISPVGPGSWHVPVQQLADRTLLDRVIQIRLHETGIIGFPDSDGQVDTDEERVGAMLGGYTLVSTDGQVILEPGCCCDLGDYDFWHQCASLQPGATMPHTIGHSEFTVSRSGPLLEMRFTDNFGTLSQTVMVDIAGLSRELPSALAGVLEFQERLVEQVADIVDPPSRARTIARLIVGLSR